MRAALVISSLGPGGAERVLSTMANYWAAKGWKIDLLTLDGTDKPPFYRLHDAVAHHPLGLYGQSRRPLEAIQRNRQRARALRDSLRRAAPQIVISFGDRTNVLTLLAAAGLRVPVIVSERADPRHWDIGLGWEMLRRWLYPRAARIVLLSAEVRCYFSATVQRKSRVIPNPVVVPEGTAPGSKLHSPSPNHQEPGARSQEPRVKRAMGMGRFTEEKGFDTLLRAFARVAPRHPEWSLELWGDGPLRPKLESLVEELALQDRASLPGRTTEPFAVMCRSDLFVLSSRTESFGNVLCEAMACGLPVVSFDCPSGPRQIIRHEVDGLLVPPGDLGALAAAMDRLMSDAGERARLAARAPEVRDRFGLERVMGMWEAVVAEVACG
jgi:glycosyltransferase involved in cell wall biosynthesis